MLARVRRFPGALCALAVLCLAPAPGEAERWYVVREGDTLTRIAARHGVTVDDIVRLNGLDAKGVIRIDQRLQLPDGIQAPPPGSNAASQVAPLPLLSASVDGQPDSDVHVIRQGDTLYALSRRYRVTVPELMRWNDMGPKDVLRIGQRLIVQRGVKQKSVEPSNMASNVAEALPQKAIAGPVSGPKTNAAPESEKAAPVEPRPDAEPPKEPPTRPPQSTVVRSEPEPGPEPVEERRTVSVSSKPTSQSFHIPFLSKRKAGSSSAYLRNCKETIDKPKIKRDQWKYVVIHHSGTSKGSAEVFEHYHRMVRGMENGLAYHFVIGNGSYTGDGEIEVGDRWLKQKAGGHLYSEFLNQISIGICFVGDFNSDRPTARQIAACIDLIDYLRKICPGSRPKFVLHREINPRPTECPGKYFPGDALRKRLK